MPPLPRHMDTPLHCTGLRRATLPTGVSVDSSADIAKDAADVVLLEKSLLVLEHGVLQGRITHGECGGQENGCAGTWWRRGSAGRRGRRAAKGRRQALNPLLGLQE